MLIIEEDIKFKIDAIGPEFDRHKGGAVAEPKVPRVHQYQW